MNRLPHIVLDLNRLNCLIAPLLQPNCHTQCYQQNAGRERGRERRRERERERRRREGGNINFGPASINEDFFSSGRSEEKER